MFERDTRTTQIVARILLSLAPIWRGSQVMNKIQIQAALAKTVIIPKVMLVLQHSGKTNEIVSPLQKRLWRFVCDSREGAQF